jgi:UDP:flavonoid glycosyltransferase YjiC (YdhE family)
VDRRLHHITLSQQFWNALKALIEVLRRYWPQLKLTLVNLAEFECATLLVLCTIELWLLAKIFINKLAGILGLITAACIL